MKTPKLIASSCFFLVGVAANAHPIAAVGTEGLLVIAGSDPVIAKYEGNSAGYSNDLYLERDALGNPGMDGIQGNDLFLFNNHASPVGSTVNLGLFAAGTELVFRLYVNDTGDNFLSGPGSRNPDGLAHARVQGGWLPSTTLVSFEDLLNLPEGDSGYNDLSFSFENTVSSGVPDGGSSLGCMAVALSAIAAARMRLRS